MGGGKRGELTLGKVIIDGMNLMDYDAMTIGPKELSLGLETLGQRLAEAEFPTLSANVMLEGSGELLAEPYAVLDVGGYRVGVIGLTRLPDEAIPDFQVLDLEETLARYVPEVSAQADTVILLTNVGYKPARRLAAGVPGIDLLIAALPAQLPNHALRISQTGTLVVTAEQPVLRHTGRRVGVLQVTMESDGSLSGESWSTIWMDKTIVDDPEMRDLLAKYDQ